MEPKKPKKDELLADHIFREIAGKNRIEYDDSGNEFRSGRARIMDFVRRAVPYVLSEIKFQHMKARKKRSFGFAIHSIVEPEHYRLDAEIDLELPDPIIHRELAIDHAGASIPVQLIGIPHIEHSCHEAIMDILDDLDREVEYMWKEVMSGKSNSDPAMFMTAARRIFRISNTDHVMILAGVIYPVKIPRVKHIVNQFFRVNPPNDPARN